MLLPRLRVLAFPPLGAAACRILGCDCRRCFFGWVLAFLHDRGQLGSAVASSLFGGSGAGAGAGVAGAGFLHDRSQIDDGRTPLAPSPSSRCVLAHDESSGHVPRRGSTSAPCRLTGSSRVATVTPGPQECRRTAAAPPSLLQFRSTHFFSQVVSIGRGGKAGSGNKRRWDSGTPPRPAAHPVQCSEHHHYPHERWGLIMRRRGINNYDALLLSLAASEGLQLYSCAERRKEYGIEINRKRTRKSI